jgi:hypothetical protein
MVQHATVEEAVFSVDLTDAPIDWLDTGHMICVSCGACLFHCYIRVQEGSGQLQVVVVAAEAREHSSKQ